MGRGNSPLIFMKALILTTNTIDFNIAKQEVAKLCIDAKPFYAIKDDNPKVSFNKSMREIMRNNDGVLALFEDDVLLRHNSHFHYAFDQLPDEWELCYLGANITGVVERYSDNLFKMNGGWTTHAVIYNNPKKICEDYFDTNHMFDDWLSTQIHPRGNTYIISPMIAWQRVHKSSLWNHVADYTHLFDASNNKLI